MRIDNDKSTGGAAVHTVPAYVPEDESLIASARLLGFEIGDDDGPYWRPGMKLREAFGLPEYGDATTKTQAARDALKAMANAINERLGR